MNFSPETGNTHVILSVSELNHSAKDLLEHAFPLLWVSGEISNLKRYDSGHWYFSLKDANAQVRCVIFSHKNKYLDWQPEDGMQVEVRALVTLYKTRGDFQLNVDTIRLAGRGALFKAFEQLKTKLEKEGLFDPACKKPLPSFPKQIGIVTSYTGAALRDVLSTLQRRMPSIPVIIYPTLVQGDSAATKIAGAIQTATKRSECDVLILCRGGGDIEDLWAFNEEVVARTIASCPIPIICGVGHETDFTIADF
ncbi:MAG: exodeoxyribonuclease VII large subunit, partial [Nitrosomonadaceae bacterium]